ncbi:signal peptidase I [Demequina lignilytica]|uniref:Signal peptidase I n=1 Tax=Demequina lignilytica TaxID=3051663 RepID=A0AAW7LZZ7_9MICO|nr:MULTISPECIES: signal peptidase I [unclassified Demequina]MDN4477205.1 signal peptidase I [Demequina sp. SYSU T00039-1]MDN4487378.1 signal peptidase I [Demequina sp. SYSU T00039]
MIVSALLLSLIIKTFFFQSFYIPSPSMVPTLEVGDRILVTKWRPDPLPLRRGDIVVFKDPNNWLGHSSEEQSGLHLVVKDVLTWTGLLPEDAGEHLIKRVIGLPGDTVVCDDPDGPVVVNGEALDEPYIAEGSRACGTTFTAVVPDGYLWVMGDNRDDSADSRAHMGDPGGGAVPRANVVGTTFAVVWPLDRFTGVGNPFGDQAVSEDD